MNPGVRRLDAASRLRRKAVHGLALAVCVLAIWALSAQAAFPGANGKIAFTSDRTGNDEIYAMSPDGSGVERLTTNAATDHQPAVSADGERMVFTSTRDGNAEIYAMNADGTGVRRLTSNAADDQEPAFSPDGERIVFRSTRDGNAEIYTMNADGSGVSRLTTSAAADRDPSYSPSGQRIVFMSKRSGNAEIHTMAPNGSAVIRLTFNAADDDEPAFSPGGGRIAFRSTRDGNFELYAMNADGTGVSRLTNNPAIDEEAAYSPDGQKITFVSDRDGNFEIYLMNPDGTDVARVTNNPTDDQDPDWGTPSAGGTVDVIPPTVQSVSPSGGATAVPPSSEVVVTFSEPMDRPATEAAFALAQGGSPVSGSFSWNGAGTELNFDPSAPLASGGYAASVSTAAADEAGNALAEQRSWGFTVDATPPPTVSHPNAAVILVGSRLSGNAASLSADDDNDLYRVNSTSGTTRTTSWYGRFDGVPASLGSLAVTYSGSNSRSCAQTIAIRRFTTSSWVQLNSRTVGTTKLKFSGLTPPGAPSDYVSGTGTVQVRIRCTTTAGTFISNGDLLELRR